MLDNTIGLNQQRFLPTTLHSLLIGWAIRLGGLVLLVVSGMLWLSLLTWSAGDPSLTITTTSNIEPTNLLGSVGAILAGLLLHIFGLSSVMMLSCLVIWSFQLLISERIDRFHVRCLLALLALFAVAGSFSSLPVSNRWEFLHGHGYGYGGILGDISYNLLIGTLISLIGQPVGLLAIFMVFGIGCLCFAYAIGIERKRLFEADREPIIHDFSHEDEIGYNKLAEEEYEQELEPTTKAKFNLSNLNPAQARLVEFGMVGNPNIYQPDTSQVEQDIPSIEPCLVDETTKNNLDATATEVPTEVDVSAKKIAKRFAPHGLAAACKNDNIAAAQRANPLNRSYNTDNEVNTKPPVFQHQSAPKKTNLNHNTGYRRPSLNELQGHKSKAGCESTAVRTAQLNRTAEMLSKVLKDFRVKGEMRDIRPGPVVTLFEFQPAPGTKASRIISLADDIARSMSAQSARVAVIPGQNAIGIELPNDVREKVLLREVFESEAYHNCDARLPLALGKGIDGKPVIADLTHMPHLLVAGTTGSGKSVGINAMILSLLYRKFPSDCRLLMIDPKMLELSAYNGIPHLLAPVITDPDAAALALQWAVKEMETRYKHMTEMGARSIEVFNNRARHAQKTGAPLVQQVHVGFDPATGTAQFQDKILDLEPMPYIAIIIDEFADLMAVAGKEIDISLKRLSQMARAAGIHLIMATQRPSVDVVTGTIKANFPTRIAYKVASKIDSRTIVNCSGAEQLLGQGDLLLANGSSSMLRAHGPFVSEDEVEAVANALKMQGAPKYNADLMDLLECRDSINNDTKKSDQQLFKKAVAILKKDGHASANFLQQQLSIGRSQAVKLIRRLEDEGLIADCDTTGENSIVA